MEVYRIITEDKNDLCGAVNLKLIIEIYLKFL